MSCYNVRQNDHKLQKYSMVDAPTKNIGGEDDGAAWACSPGDVGPVASREVVDDSTGLAATERHVRWVVLALRVLTSSNRRRPSKNDGEAEEKLRGSHGLTGTSGILVAAALLRRVYL